MRQSLKQAVREHYPAFADYEKGINFFNPTEEEVRIGLEGNLCRCTGYHNIVKAVLDAAGRMKVAQAAE